MFPTIPRISAFQASVRVNQNAGFYKVNSLKSATDSYPKFSSSGAKTSAVRILHDVNTFIHSTQTAPGDVQALRGLLRERWLVPSCIGKKFVPQQRGGTKYAVQQTAQILSEVDSFLTSRHTTREDGVALRRLISHKSLINSSSGIGCTVYHKTKTEVLNPENSGSLTTYQKLVENWPEIFFIIRKRAPSLIRGSNFYRLELLFFRRAG